MTELQTTRMLDQVEFYKGFPARYFECSELLLHYLAFIQAQICTTCFYEKHTRLIEVGNMQYAGNPGNDSHTVFIGHHSGEFNKAVDGARRISYEDFRTFEQDPKHGLMHGLCTGFLGFLAHPPYLTDFVEIRGVVSDKGGAHSKFFASALLHDFVKCVTGEHADHDKDLQEFFPNLLPITYRHVKPVRCFHPIIAGDRMELLRFEDHADWVDSREVEAACDTAPWELAATFRTFFLPAFKKLLRHRNEPWFKHGAESLHPTGHWDSDFDWDKGFYPQSDTHMNMLSGHGSREGYSVDTMASPFGECFTHGAEYSQFGGILPVRAIEGTSVQARPCWFRAKKSSAERGFEHPCIEGYPSLDDWVFWFRGDPRENKYKEHICEVFAKGIAVIPMELGRIWVNTIDQLIARLVALRI